MSIEESTFKAAHPARFRTKLGTAEGCIESYPVDYVFRIEWSPQQSRFEWLPIGRSLIPMVVAGPCRCADTRRQILHRFTCSPTHVLFTDSRWGHLWRAWWASRESRTMFRRLLSSFTGNYSSFYSSRLWFRNCGESLDSFDVRQNLDGFCASFLRRFDNIWNIHWSVFEWQVLSGPHKSLSFIECDEGFFRGRSSEPSSSWALSSLLSDRISISGASSFCSLWMSIAFCSHSILVMICTPIKVYIRPYGWRSERRYSCE
jgi:hypothetical protein